jgi:hypothetical protein
VQLNYYGYIKFFGGFVGTWVGAFTYYQNMYHNKRKSFINGLFTPFKKLCLLFELGKSKGILKYICLSFVPFLPLFYFNCIYYFGLLIFCCQFVASLSC